MIRLKTSEARKLGLTVKPPKRQRQDHEEEKPTVDLMPPPARQDGPDFAHPDLVLTLPWPPTVNTYWRMVNNRMVISRKGREYKQRVAAIVAYERAARGWRNHIAVRIDLYPPDRRQRDIDNTQKAILDSLQEAGVYLDDNQITDLELHRGPIVKGGVATVRIVVEKDQ